MFTLEKEGYRKFLHVFFFFFFVGPCVLKVNGVTFPSVFESFYLARLCDLWAPSVLFRTVCPPSFQVHCLVGHENYSDKSKHEKVKIPSTQRRS